MLHKTLSIISVAYALFCGGCNGTVEQSSIPTTADPIYVKSVHERVTPEILIDTMLKGIGSVQVAYHPTTQKLCIKSWEKQDTISGYTDWVSLNDSLPLPVVPVLGIGYIHDNEVKYSNIVSLKSGLLVFAIADQEHRANLYAVRKSGNTFNFLCNSDGVCSHWDSTPDCKILDTKRDRLLTVVGTDYDEARDLDIQTIVVQQYGYDRELDIGTLKINNWRDDQCKDAAILTWWKAYLKIADQKHFDQYLAIPKKSHDGED